MKATILVGDVLERLKDIPDGSVQTCVTSPPFWGLRDYGTGKWEGGDILCDHKKDETYLLSRNVNSSTLGGGKDNQKNSCRSGESETTCRKCGAQRIDLQIGLEKTPQEYVEKIVAVFREVKRVLRDDGTLWLNLGDSYTGSGKGGNPEAGKQATNKGSQTVGVLYGKTGDQQKEVAQTNVTRKYNEIPAKNLVGIPWRVAFALQDDGWILRSEIIWSKKNPMPESVEDRPTKAHEQIFLLSKNSRYFYDKEAIAEDAINTGKVVSLGDKSFSKGQANGLGIDASGNGTKDEYTVVETRNKRSVWEITTQPFPEAHFATFPEALIEPCVLAGTSEYGSCHKCGSPWKRVVKKSGGTTGYSWHDHSDDLGSGMTQVKHGGGVGNAKDENGQGYKVETVGWEATCKCVFDKLLKPCLVLDPFCGSGTTGVVSLRYHRDFIGCELNPQYASMAERRIGNEAPMFNEVEVK